jgi:hypothetical protein
LPVADVSGGVLVCADVLEHLRFPERTLRRVREALDRGADAFVLSTPERDLAEGLGHPGPPRNPAHVREWNTAELQRFLESHGLDGLFGLTRSNDYLDQLHTTFVVVPGAADEHRRLVELWFRAREPWERRSIEQAEKLANERARVEEFAAAVRWYKEQLASAERSRVDASRRADELRAELDRRLRVRARRAARALLRRS